MKIQHLTAMLTLALASCSQADLYNSEANNGNSNYVNTDLSNIVPTRAMKVEVPEGQAVVITNKFSGDTIATLTDSRTIDVPSGLLKTNSTTRAAKNNNYTANDFNVNVEYITGDQVAKIHTNLTYYDTVVFEDADNNDYDYNDIVFHTMMKFSDTGKPWSSSVKVQPIAFGAKNTIDVKAEAYIFNEDGSIDKTITIFDIKDARKNMFLNSTEEFINTDVEQIEKNGGLTHYQLVQDIWYSDFPAVGKTQFIDVVYSIYVHETGKTYRSIPMTQRLADKQNSEGKKYNISFDKNNIPFGLVFSDIYGGRPFTSNGKSSSEWFIYPQEREPIENVYPNFREWLEGAASTVNWSAPVGNYINTIGDANETSLYSFSTSKNWKPEIVTRANLTKFDITQFFKKN